MSSARAYRPVAYERPREPVLVEWLLRVTIGLALFAGFLALGRATAPAPSSEATPPARVVASRAAAVVPRALSGTAPLEHAFAERAAAEREEATRAAAAARARQRAAQLTARGRTAGANSGTPATSLTGAPTATQPAQPSAPLTQSAAPPPQPVQRHSGSNGSGGSFESSG
jgi:hypothetical protein